MTFRTPGGLYKFKLLLFGMVNVPTIFHAVINNIFFCQIGKSTLAYLDDILVYSKTLEEHIKHLKEVLEILKTQKLSC